MLYVDIFADGHIHTSDALDKGFAMLDKLVSIGITDMSLLSIPIWNADDNLAALYYKMKYDKLKIRVFGGFHYDEHFGKIPFKEQAEKLFALGFDGIKLIEMKPNVRRDIKMGINNPLYDEMFSMLEERGAPVLCHTNDPETFWDIDHMTPEEIARGWWYGDGSYLTKAEIYKEAFEMLEKHPKLNITFAHFFFLSNELAEAERVMEKYPNVKFDLTPGWEMYVGFSKNIEAWHDFFVRYSDRILYGTDTSNSNPGFPDIHKLVRLAVSHDMSEFQMPVWGHTIKGLNLGEAEQKKIFYSNYINFAGESPKPVDKVLYKETVAEMLAKIKGDMSQERSEKWLSEILKEL